MAFIKTVALASIHDDRGAEVYLGGVDDIKVGIIEGDIASFHGSTKVIGVGKNFLGRDKNAVFDAIFLGRLSFPTVSPRYLSVQMPGFTVESARELLTSTLLFAASCFHGDPCGVVAAASPNQTRNLECFCTKTADEFLGKRDLPVHRPARTIEDLHYVCLARAVETDKNVESRGKLQLQLVKGGKIFQKKFP